MSLRRIALALAVMSLLVLVAGTSDGGAPTKSRLITARSTIPVS